MDYIELAVNLTPRNPFADLFIDALGDVGFESFVENENGFLAYIQQQHYAEGLEKTCWAWNMEGVAIETSTTLIPRKNWNKDWEENFKPIVVDNKVYIHAPFHPKKPAFAHRIVIEPKMSFGTGHHQTTHLMVQLTLKQTLLKKRVLDMGCGTGILAILAAQMGANPVVAIDIDDWSIENTKENAARNKVGLETRLGGAEELKAEKFDVILANINLNILMADMAAYRAVLEDKGTIIFSGFYAQDLETLRAEAQKCGLQLTQSLEREDWIAAVFVNAKD